MFRRLASAVLVITVLSLSLTPVYAASDNKQQAQFESKIKEAVLKLGTGSTAQVELKLSDKTRIKGYVAEASDDRFVSRFSQQRPQNYTNPDSYSPGPHPATA